ncbi:MAG TPA: zinc ribbon domain-containing protein [Kofleriaceae bacterium]|nr:zinc ribbon domain-containing protein [Kofleriaceae bacterium]
MPIYEYRCKKCGKTFEYMQRMSDSPKKKCEACGASALERLISNTSFQLKGSGWYKDLYSSAKPAPSASDSGSDSGSGSGSGSGSESGSGSGSGSETTASSDPKPKAEKKEIKDKKAKKGSAK